MPRGHADGLVGAYVSGWAASGLHGDPEPCRVTVETADGTVLASGLANRKRPDLAVLGGRINIGFRILVEDFAGSPLLRVRADRVELPNSPIYVGPDRFDGDFALHGDVATGWVRARVPYPSSPRVTLHADDGTEVGASLAEYVIEAADPHASRARFRIEIADRMFGIGEFTLVARADGRAFARALGHLPIDGYLDVLDAGHCAGWLICVAAPHRQLQLEMLRDGIVAGRGRCSVDRADLREHYPVGWRNGFSVPLKPCKAADRQHLSSISIRTKNGGIELLGGPHLLGNRDTFLSLARGLARLAHRPAFGTDAGEATMPTMSDAERALLQEILRRHLAERRHGSPLEIIPALATGAQRSDRGVDVLVPVYKGIEITEVCIFSVLAALGAGDRLILVADCPPESGMSTMLERFGHHEDVVLLRNEVNLGFVGSVNRGLAYSAGRDVLLLNSDTRLFAGGLAEMRRILHGAHDIGTVTALSNNATIFSYPHPALPVERLADIGWSEVARLAAGTGTGRSVDVPTGHGFCMLIRREVLDRLGRLNEAFGRGYGEENELCLRATDLGFRHVAALGAFVEHRESVSFGDDKKALILANLPRLEQMYPEYTAMIMRFEAQDPLRVARWNIDAARLRTASASGTRFVLIVHSWLGGGTSRALTEIGEAVGYEGRTEVQLRNTRAGVAELDCAGLVLRATFLDGDSENLVDVLDAAGIDLVILHQLLGFGPKIVDAVGRWCRDRRSIAYVHDFYCLCPRVTLINAVESYCGVQPAAMCDRCIAIGGAHDASKLDELTATEHRALFGRVLSGMHAVAAPSEDAVRHVQRAFPQLSVRAIPHPERARPTVSISYVRDPNAIALLGAIGPHKGADKLLELVRLAALSHPDLRWHVLGHTSLDETLGKLPNVFITGEYEPAELPGLIAASRSAVALFLHVWPETFSYTLSEAVRAGLLPVVPDIGAPAERVRKTGWGRIFPFPAAAPDVLAALDDARASLSADVPSPERFDTSAASVAMLRRLFSTADALIGEPPERVDISRVASMSRGRVSQEVVAKPATM